MGNTTYDGYAVPLARPAPRINVYRYTGYRYERAQPTDPDVLFAGDDPKPRMELLPNVFCLGIERAVGPNPGQAKLRYRLDSSGAINPGDWPTRVSEVFGANAWGGPYVVRPNDRLCVTAVSGDGVEDILFDGFVKLPAAGYTEDAQNVDFTAIGTPVRCWDYPLSRGVFRSMDKPEDNTNDRPADAIRIHFNPVGPDGLARPNATPKACDGRTRFLGPNLEVKFAPHAVFIDPEYAADHKFGRFWSVGMAVKYILARGNGGQAFVMNPGVTAPNDFPEVLPDFARMDSIFDRYEPKPGVAFDLKDPNSYTPKPIPIQDLDVTGMPWPEALQKVIEPFGFTFCFRLALDSDGFPVWGLDFYRSDQGPYQAGYPLLMQAEGSMLDPGLTNLARLNITRDASEVINEYAVVTSPARHECDLVLAPLWEPNPADCATVADLAKFNDNNAANKAVPTKYREYGFDECGEGHWDFDKGAVAFKAPSLVAVLGGPAKDENGNPIAEADRQAKYVNRRRKCSRTLLSRDSTNLTDDDEDDDESDLEEQGSIQEGDPGRKRRAILLLSWDYKGPRPGVWDGTGTWHIVKGWALLDDRIGVRLTATDLDGWNTGNPNIAFGPPTAMNSGGVVKAITSQASAAGTRFSLRLVTVIEGDDAPDVVAKRRNSSSTRFTVRRYIEGDRKYRLDIVHAKTYYNGTAADVTVRDDREAAMRNAVAQRDEGEQPPFSGSATIPRLVKGYKLGHKILGIYGRDVSFRLDSGLVGSTPRYPLVVSIAWDFQDGQSTTLQLSDDRQRRSDQ